MRRTSFSLPAETIDGLKKIGKFRSPRNPISMAGVIRELVEEELEAMEKMPCHQDPPAKETQ